MPYIMHRWIEIFSLSSLITLGCFSCAPQNLTAKSPVGQSELPPEESPPPPPTSIRPVKEQVIDGKKTITEYFSTNPSTQQLDFVLVVDNSSSMDAHIKIVNAEIQKFISGLASRRDVQLLLLGSDKASDKNIVILPQIQDTPFKSWQLAYKVESRDPAMLAAAASCPLDATAASANPNEDSLYCAALRGEKTWAPISNCEGYSSSSVKPDLAEVKSYIRNYGKRVQDNVMGKFNNQSDTQVQYKFRPGANRNYILVTDDESFMNHCEIAAAMNLGSTNSKTRKTIHSFVRKYNSKTPSGGRCQTNTGNVYQHLAEVTGGQSFDICQSDWSSAFNQISEQVLKPVSREVPIFYNDKFIGVDSVKIAGAVVPKDKYSFDIDKKTITFQEGVLDEKVMQEGEISLLLP